MDVSKRKTYDLVPKGGKGDNKDGKAKPKGTKKG
jgi:hypothetical protein